IMAYLQQRNPNDGAALLPPEFPVLRAKPEGAILRAAPNDNARVLATITPEQRIFPFTKENGWYEVVVRGEWRTIGWVREDQVEETNEPVVVPTPANS
nr:SH3 domain-containing protein [Chloroflexaceae bacterium]